MAILLGLGSAGSGTGIKSIVLSSKHCHKLSTNIDQDFQKLQAVIDDLADSLQSLSEVVLQNHKGLDLILLQQGGLCAAQKERCCFYVDMTGLVKDTMQKVREGIEKRRLERAKGKSWHKKWFLPTPR